MAIQWFPGHMNLTRKLIAERIKEIDVVIEVLDAHNELTMMELQQAMAVNDFRDAALSYLHARASLCRWAGLPPSGGALASRDIIQPTVILQEN